MGKKDKYKKKRSDFDDEVMQVDEDSLDNLSQGKINIFIIFYFLI